MPFGSAVFTTDSRRAATIKQSGCQLWRFFSNSLNINLLKLLMNGADQIDESCGGDI